MEVGIVFQKKSFKKEFKHDSMLEILYDTDKSIALTGLMSDLEILAFEVHWLKTQKEFIKCGNTEINTLELEMIDKFNSRNTGNKKVYKYPI